MTLGSISSTAGSETASRPESFAGSPWTDVTLNIPPSPQTVHSIASEDHYVNIDSPKIMNSEYYCEKTESHYARLSQVKSKIGNIRRIEETNTNSLNFYPKVANEQRARSQSRGRESRCRSKSRERPSEGRSPSRGRSASRSRDIMALYTNRPVSNCKLVDRSPSPPRRQNSGRASVSERDSGISFQEKDEDMNFVTLLEMDTEKCAQIEQQLTRANSLKPANIKMMMIASHCPTNDWSAKDEISARAGAIVTGIYKQNEWLFAMTEDRDVGFIPFAYTKPVKVAEQLQRGRRIATKKITTPAAEKQVTGILKHSSNHKQKSRRSPLPKYSVKVRTVTDTDSLSSDASAAIMDDFVYTRQQNRIPSPPSTCIIIDTDSNFSPPMLPTPEEMGTYSSDSGISDPNSNHSDDLDMLHSPSGFTFGMHRKVAFCDSLEDSGIGSVDKTAKPKAPVERIVSVTTENLGRETPTTGKSRRERFSDISSQPLGPLGARLAKISINHQKQDQSRDSSKPKSNKSALAKDMKDRAKSSGPSSLRPEIPKDYGGPRVTVVFDYDGENDDDLVVHASDVVTVLNGEDIEWIWVLRRDGKEGFIPRDYVIPVELSVRNRRQIGVTAL